MQNQLRRKEEKDQSEEKAGGRKTLHTHGID